MSSSVQSRVEDIHEAFKDKKVKAILTVIGGYNSNQLLKYLDYNLIKNNPKILCGYSDITALTNAITHKTGLITYSGPHFSTWAMEKGFDHILNYFRKCLMSNKPFSVISSEKWSDDSWYRDQKKRLFIKNEGYKTINGGKAEGRIIGGNLCTFNLLQGTEYMPDLAGSILFLEDDDMAGDYFSVEFDRNLQSIISQPGFERVRGIVLGRFQTKTDINFEKIKQIIKTKTELKNIPVACNFDFGHTYPMITFPIGGKARLTANKKRISLEIMEH
jgi:muramoyltetrapeptide carboxypeptidase